MHRYTTQWGYTEPQFKRDKKRDLLQRPIPDWKSASYIIVFIFPKSITVFHADTDILLPKIIFNLILSVYVTRYM